MMQVFFIYIYIYNLYNKFIIYVYTTVQKFLFFKEISLMRIYLKWNFCNIIKVFTFTFDHFNASLLNKIFNLSL